MITHNTKLIKDDKEEYLPTKVMGCIVWNKIVADDFGNNLQLIVAQTGSEHQGIPKIEEYVKLETVADIFIKEFTTTYYDDDPNCPMYDDLYGFNLSFRGAELLTNFYKYVTNSDWKSTVDQARREEAKVIYVDNNWKTIKVEY